MTALTTLKRRLPTTSLPSRFSLDKHFPRTGYKSKGTWHKPTSCDFADIGQTTCSRPSSTIALLWRSSHATDFLVTGRWCSVSWETPYQSPSNQGLQRISRKQSPAKRLLWRSLMNSLLLKVGREF